MKSGLDGIRWIDLPSVTDDRGTLTAVEASADIPFEIRRIFYMHHISAERGGHAHRDTDQVIIGISGSHVVEVKDARRSLRFVLDTPQRGLYLPRMTFTSLMDFSPGAVSLVLASTHYDRARSIRTFGEYLSLLQAADA
jgi:dTDP-4-dehydrorhamnose 3,5-epimerase-like enzyme